LGFSTTTGAPRTLWSIFLKKEVSKVSGKAIVGSYLARQLVSRCFVYKHSFFFLIANFTGSSAQLATFSSCKAFFSHYEFFADSIFFTALAASMVSGLFTCICMTPFDVVATRLFNQGTHPETGKGLLYKNIVDCFIKTVKIEGVRGLYKGFFANYWRLVPHTILNLTFWEQFKNWNDLYLQNY
jgi:Mitochondrial carrier protein